MKKKLLSLVLCLVMSLTLTSCGGNGGTAPSNAGNDAGAEEAQSGSEDAQPAKAAVTRETLGEYLIGTQRATTGNIYCVSEFGEDHVTAYDNAITAVQALLNGQVDCVVIDNAPAQVLVSQNPGLSILDTEYVTEDYAIAIGKNNTALLDAVNGVLAELTADGTIQSILDKYISADSAEERTAAQESDESDAGEAAQPASASFTTVVPGKLTMSTNAAFPPYEMTTDDGGYEGIDIEIAEKIAEKLGLELQVDDMDFDAALLAVQNGKSDIAMAGVSVTDERLAVMDFSNPYATGIQVIIVKDGSN